ncbi:MAG: hypothetical protein SW019_15320 [Actinomycetota bacterium]|nr:hypothetical protein [Actinomycetota bacterium]
MQKKIMTPVATAVGAGLSAAVLGLAAPAMALPVAGDNAADAIAELESDDNRVIVENRSDVPLSQAQVVSVIEGPAVRDTVYQNDQYVINETRQRVPVGNVYYVTVR